VQTLHVQDRLLEPVVQPGSALVMWLGQAGFAIKFRSAMVWVDPYLSNYLAEWWDVERIAPRPFAPQDVAPDVVIASHWHPDHLDPPTCRALAKSSRAIFVVPPSGALQLGHFGVPQERIRTVVYGDRIDVAGVAVSCYFARHDVEPGLIAEDAMTMSIEMDGVHVFHSGDTEYDNRIWESPRANPVDAALVCMNGTGGNMDALEAAFLAFRLDARLAVPMHFGMWSDADYGPRATLDPAEFVAFWERLTAGRPSHVPVLGETFVIHGRAPV
jgi:L-ascorbate 6-phosphate lactonase